MESFGKNITQRPVREVDNF